MGFLFKCLISGVLLMLLDTLTLDGADRRQFVRQFSNRVADSTHLGKTGTFR
jgi:hypothetical protein